MKLFDGHSEELLDLRIEIIETEAHEFGETTTHGGLANTTDTGQEDSHFSSLRSKISSLKRNPVFGASMRPLRAMESEARARSPR